MRELSPLDLGGAGVDGTPDFVQRLLKARERSDRQPDKVIVPPSFYVDVLADNDSVRLGMYNKFEHSLTVLGMDVVVVHGIDCVILLDTRNEDWDGVGIINV